MLKKSYAQLSEGRSENIAIMQYPNGKFYNWYGYNYICFVCNCVAGPFDTLEEAEKAVRSHRGKAIEVVWLDTYPAFDQDYCKWFCVPADWFKRAVLEDYDSIEEFENEYTWDDTDRIYNAALAEKVVLSEETDQRGRTIYWMRNGQGQGRLADSTSGPMDTKLTDNVETSVQQTPEFAYFVVRTDMSIERVDQEFPGIMIDDVRKVFPSFIDAVVADEQVLSPLGVDVDVALIVSDTFSLGSERNDIASCLYGETILGDVIVGTRFSSSLWPEPDVYAFEGETVNAIERALNAVKDLASDAKEARVKKEEVVSDFYKREQIGETEEARRLIDDFCFGTTGRFADFSDVCMVEVAKGKVAGTANPNHKLTVIASINLYEYSLDRYAEDSGDLYPIDSEKHMSLRELVDNKIKTLDRKSLLSVSDEAIDRICQQIEDDHLERQAERDFSRLEAEQHEKGGGGESGHVLAVRLAALGGGSAPTEKEKSGRSHKNKEAR